MRMFFLEFDLTVSSGAGSPMALVHQGRCCRVSVASEKNPVYGYGYIFIAGNYTGMFDWP